MYKEARGFIEKEEERKREREARGARWPTQPKSQTERGTNNPKANTNAIARVLSTPHTVNLRQRKQTASTDVDDGTPTSTESQEKVISNNDSRNEKGTSKGPTYRGGASLLTLSITLNDVDVEEHGPRP
jgi:hypothetical protein